MVYSAGVSWRASSGGLRGDSLTTYFSVVARTGAALCARCCVYGSFTAYVCTTAGPVRSQRVSSDGARAVVGILQVYTIKVFWSAQRGTEWAYFIYALGVAQ